MLYVNEYKIVSVPLS